MAKPVPEVERELDRRVDELGFEVVQVEWAGSGRRPILRIRIDVRGGSDPRDAGGGVTVDDCAAVSRALESWLDTVESLPATYVLEVSSPGVERPLTRERDWSRFVGETVALKGGDALLAGRATYLEGELLGRETDERGRDVVRLRLGGGEELEIEGQDIRAARLLFRWS